eukprot:g42133.t1
MEHDMGGQTFRPSVPRFGGHDIDLREINRKDDTFYEACVHTRSWFLWGVFLLLDLNLLYPSNDCIVHAAPPGPPGISDPSQNSSQPMHVDCNLVLRPKRKVTTGSKFCVCGCRRSCIYGEFCEGFTKDYWERKELLKRLGISERTTAPEVIQAKVSAQRVRVHVSHFDDDMLTINTRAQGTFFSSYKHTETLKTIQMTTGVGCFIPSRGWDIQEDRAEPSPGKCSDTAILARAELQQLCAAGHLSLADKGFLCHALFAAVGHRLETPWKRFTGVMGFEQEAMRHTDAVGNIRIHVERAFARVLDWQILRRTVKLSEMDFFASIWFVCTMLCNLDVDLVRQ